MNLPNCNNSVTSEDQAESLRNCSLSLISVNFALVMRFPFTPCLRCVLLVLLILATPVFLHCEDLTAYVFASDFIAQDKVVEIDFPVEMEGRRFVLAWDRAGQSAGYAPFMARAGKHSYEMRNISSWQGAIRHVAINIEGASARVKTPGVADEVDMFFSPEWIQPSTINAVSPHTLFAWPWDTLLLLVFGFAVLWFSVVRKKAVSHALLLGFTLSWAVSDVRFAVDDVMVVRAQERHPGAMHPFLDAKPFGDEAARIIQGTWTHGSAGEGANFVWYRLAELPFVPAASSSPDTYWIADDDAGSAVLLQRGTYRLFQKKNRP